VIWEELKAMDEAHFRFAEKDQPSEFTSSTASSMQRCYPPDWVLSAPHLIREFDFEAIKHCLSFLRPDKFRVVFVAKEISENLPEKERWYGTEYSCNPLPESLLKVITYKIFY
jgi:insulysin